MVCIGWNVLSGSRRARKTVIQSLRRFCGEQVSRSTGSAGAEHRESFLAARIPASGSDTSADEAANFTLAQYAVALKERGDGIGICPRYEVRTLRQYPALFKATVFMQGRSFEGEGSTKKQGKHEAAKNACKSMGIVPT